MDIRSLRPARLRSGGIEVEIWVLRSGSVLDAESMVFMLDSNK